MITKNKIEALKTYLISVLWEYGVIHKCDTKELVERVSKVVEEFEKEI